VAGVPKAGVSVSRKTRVLVVFGVALLLILATRLPFIPQHLYSFDSVNLALALREFNPALHQPQPPGYPLFVTEAKIIYWVAETPEHTFTILKILISSFSVMLLYLLGRQMFSPYVGVLAAGLLFVNPVFWYAGLTSSLRLHLALVSTLVAYFCWRACNGEHRYFYAASLAAGLGGGFRPELSLFLLPLWIWTARQCRSKLLLFHSSLLFLMGTAIWVLVLAKAYGGLGAMITSFNGYFLEQSQSAMVLLGSPSDDWRRMVGRALLWAGVGVFSWMWAIPLAWRGRKASANWNRQAVFLALWFFPAFIFHLLVHIGDPGHALATIPALCMTGAFFIAEAHRVLAREGRAHSYVTVSLVLLALAGNVALFWWPYSVPQRKEVAGFRGWASLQDAVRVGIFETSYSNVRYVGQTTSLALQQIEALKSEADRPIVVVWNRDAVPVWRKVTFYNPSELVYETAGRRTSRPQARLWMGTKMIFAVSGPPTAKLPVRKKSRVIWVVHPDSVKDLARVVPLKEAFPVYYTDLDEDSLQFEWGSLKFVQAEKFDTPADLCSTTEPLNGCSSLSIRWAPTTRGNAPPGVEAYEP
jgi:hypothetical protein